MLGTGCKPWSKNPDIEMDSLYYDDHPDRLENSMKAFKEILEKAEERGVGVVGVIFPQNPAYRKTGAFGRYGLRRSLAKEVIDDLKALEKTYPHFKLLDENKMGNHDYTDEMAQNRDHLSYKGAEQMTSRLDSVLKTLRWTSK
jgi:sugar phosphate isomerase/epimerase